MRLIQFINEKKFTVLCILLFVYLASSLLEGERGLVSHFENQRIKKELIEKKNKSITQLYLIEKKNKLLTKNIDLDYLEILYREKFLVGKSNEKIYSIN